MCFWKKKKKPIDVIRGLSHDGLKFIMQWEGFRKKAYLDAAGLVTIGYGHLLTKSEISSGKLIVGKKQILYKSGISDSISEKLLMQDVKLAEDVVIRRVKVKLTQDQFDSLVSLVYNIGQTAFKNSTLLKVLNKKKYDEVPSQMQRWIYAAGKIVVGLVTRRDEEALIFSRIALNQRKE